MFIMQIKMKWEKVGNAGKWCEKAGKSQFCSAGYVLGGFFKESKRRGVEIAGKNEKDLSRELAAGKARPGEARD